MITDIFDALNRASDANHRYWEIKRLERQNHEIKTTCGSCKKWMHSNECEREKHHKVSCDEFICNEFKMKKSSADLISKNEENIKELSK